MSDRRSWRLHLRNSSSCWMGWYGCWKGLKLKCGYWKVFQEFCQGCEP